MCLTTSRVCRRRLRPQLASATPTFLAWRSDGVTPRLCRRNPLPQSQPGRPLQACKGYNRPLGAKGACAGAQGGRIGRVCGHRLWCLASGSAVCGAFCGASLTLARRGPLVARYMEEGSSWTLPWAPKGSALRLKRLRLVRARYMAQGAQLAEYHALVFRAGRYDRSIRR